MPEMSANASRVSEIARVLAGHFREVAVLCPFPTLPFGRFPHGVGIRENSRVDGVMVHKIWSWRPLGSNPHVLSKLAFYGSFSLLAVLWCFFQGSRHSVVVTSTPPLLTALPGLVAKKILGIPWIVDYRDHWVAASVDIGVVKGRSLLARIGRLLERRILREADSVFVVHPSMVDVLARTSDSSDMSRFVVLPNGVDTNQFRPTGKEKKRRLIYSGNISLACDFRNLILAMPAIARRHGVKLLILGEGDAREEVASLIRTNGLAACVTVAPPVPRSDLPPIISESILGVATVKELESLDCSVPMKLYEYMACGVPFIGSGGTAMRDLASKSSAGLVVENDVTTIVDAVGSLLEDPDRIRQMGENGREFVSEHRDTRQLTGIALAEIRKLVDGEKPSDSSLARRTRPSRQFRRTRGGRRIPWR